jgi:hypothetical protein
MRLIKLKLCKNYIKKKKWFLISFRSNINYVCHAIMPLWLLHIIDYDFSWLLIPTFYLFRCVWDDMTNCSTCYSQLLVITMISWLFEVRLMVGCIWPVFNESYLSHNDQLVVWGKVNGGMHMTCFKWIVPLSLIEQGIT